MIQVTLYDSYATGRVLLLQPSEISSVLQPDGRERWASTITMANGTVYDVTEGPETIARLLASSDPSGAEGEQ